MKKIMIVMILASCLLLAGCDANRVRISRNSVQIENIVLPVRQGFRFAEDAYTIEETETGYDIIVHIEKEIEK